MRFEPGVAPSNMIPLCVPEIRGNEWTYVKDCLDTGWVSSVGTYVNRFESELARYVGAEHGIATVNGTSALHVALLVAGVQPDDEVLVSTLTFIAPANAIRYVGAWPVFVDAEPDHWQMDVSRVADFLEHGCRWVDGHLRNQSTGRRVKAIIPVHILGHPVPMEPLMALGRKYGLAVIEDATESLGARYAGRMVGGWGDMACFSFNGNKLLTTGGGGMLVVNDKQAAEYARHLTTQAKLDPLEYVHDRIGYNYRLTNIQAAVGCAQLEKVQEYIEAKRRIAAYYRGAFQSVPGLTSMPEAAWAYSVFWMFTVLVDQTAAGHNSRELLSELARRGVQTRPLWQPLHRSPAHPDSFRLGGETADGIHAKALSLPCSAGITDAQLEMVSAAVKECCKR